MGVVPEYRGSGHDRSVPSMGRVLGTMLYAGDLPGWLYQSFKESASRMLAAGSAAASAAIPVKIQSAAPSTRRKDLLEKEL